MCVLFHKMWRVKRLIKYKATNCHMSHFIKDIFSTKRSLLKQLYLRIIIYVTDVVQKLFDNCVVSSVVTNIKLVVIKLAALTINLRVIFQQFMTAKFLIILSQHIY